MTKTGPLHIAHRDAKMAGVIKKVGPCTLRPRRQRFHSLVRAIVGQQISTKAARAVFERLRVEAGGYITAERIGRLRPHKLKTAGLSEQKTKYILTLSEQILSRDFRFERLDELDDEAALAALTTIHGVGRWTAEMFLMFVLNRSDILPMGDIGIQEGFRRVYNLAARPSENKMLALSEPWQPYRTIGSWYLWRYLDAVPEDY